MRAPWSGPRTRLARLARRAAAGDRTSFVELYRELYGPTWGFVRARVQSRADAEDLVSLVFHRVLEKLHQFDPARGSVRTWVLAMAKNAIIDHHRRRRTPAAVDDIEEVVVDGGLTPLELLEHEQHARVARELLARQPAEIREMFALRFGDGLRYREIAELLGLSEAAVKQRFSRTLRELRVAAEKVTREQGMVDYAV